MALEEYCRSRDVLIEVQSVETQEMRCRCRDMEAWSVGARGGLVQKGHRVGMEP